MTQTYRRIVLASRPRGAATLDNFRMESLPMPPLAEGQVRVRNHFLSLDPYMRARMNEGKSYAAPQALGETMVGGTVGEVIESRAAAFGVGDRVVGHLGWADHGVSDVAGLRKIRGDLPLSVHLGVVGMPGMTAWYGVNKILAPKRGETLVVSAASGAVGSVVGQLGRLAGARVVGIAGGPEKCRYVTDELGLDACIDHKTATDAGGLAALIAAAAPQGVDAHFENVGGDVLNAVMTRLNTFARVAICGLISGYDEAPEQLSRNVIANPRLFLTARFTMRGFIVSDHPDLWPEGLEALAADVAAGRIKYRESIATGLAAAPTAFLGLLKGANFGKQLVRLI